MNRVQTARSVEKRQDQNKPKVQRMKSQENASERPQTGLSTSKKPVQREKTPTFKSTLRSQKSVEQINREKKNIKSSSRERQLSKDKPILKPKKLVWGKNYISPFSHIVDPQKARDEKNFVTNQKLEFGKDYQSQFTHVVDPKTS